MKKFNKSYNNSIYYLKDYIHLFGLLLILFKVFELFYPIFLSATPNIGNYDYFYLFEGARTFIKNGVPSISYWPNSSSGLDIFSWVRPIQIISLATIIKALSLPTNSTEIILIFDSLSKIFSFGIIFLCLKKFYNYKKAILVLSVLLIDPVCQFFIFNKQYAGLQYGILFYIYISLLSLAYNNNLQNSLNLKQKYYVVFLGMLSFVGIFWFLPIGLIFINSILFSSIFFVILNRKSFFFFFSSALLFLLGLLISIIIFCVIIILFYNSKIFFVSLYDALSIYFEFGSTENKIKSIVYFLIKSLFPNQGFSIIPISCFVLIISLFNYQISNFTKKNNFEYIILCAVVSSICAYFFTGIIFPTNTYLARLSFALPLIIVCLNNPSFQSFFKEKFIFFISIITSYIFCFLMFKGLLFFINTKNALIISTSLIIIFISICCFFLYYKQNKIIKIKTFPLQKNGIRFIYIIVSFLYIFNFINSNKVWDKKFLFNEDLAGIKEFVQNEITKNSSYIVTNLTISHLYKNRDMHAIQSYKGLINGVVSNPGSGFLIFSHQKEWAEKCIDNNYKYGLHSYKIIKSEEITKNVFVCVGTSFIPNSDEKLINLDTLHDKVIDIYIKKLGI